MSEEENIKYCYFCGIKLNQEAKYCAGCGTHLEEEKSFDIKRAQSTQEDAAEAKNATSEPIQEESSTLNPSNSNDLGLAVGAALLFGHRIHRRVQRHRRHMTRRMMRHNRMIRHNRTMRRGY